MFKNCKKFDIDFSTPDSDDSYIFYLFPKFQLYIVITESISWGHELRG